MADLNKVRVQVLDPATGAVIENVDVKTSDAAVYLPDGTTLRDWMSNSELVHTDIQRTLAEHLAKKAIDVDKIDDIVTGISYDSTTGKFTITNHDGSTEEIDTLLEKLAINFDLVDGDGIDGYAAGDKLLKVTLDDGTVKYANLSDLIDVYTAAMNAKEVQLDVLDNVISASLVDGGIATAKIADSAVTTAKIADANVTTAKVADSAITTAKIADANVTTAKIADGNVTRAKIDSTFEAQIAALETAAGKAEDGTYVSVDTKITNAIEALDATVTNVVEANEEQGIEAFTPDVAVSITEVDGKITAVSTTVKENTFEAYGAAAAVQGETTETVASVDAKVSALTTSSSVTVEKLATATEGFISSYVVKQNGTQVGATIDIPKDYLVKSAELKVATEAIKSGETTIVAKDHQYIDFVVNTVGTDGNESHIYLDVNNLVDVYTAAMNAKEVQLDVSDNVISASLVDGGIATAKLADSAVTTAKIADANITTAKIADANVTTDKIADANVTTAKIADSAVTNAKIADATIARAKIDSDFEDDIAAIEDELADKITLGEDSVNLNLGKDADTVVVAVSGPTKSTVYTTAGTAVEAITVSASKTGAKAEDATLAYQWYTKVVGTDVAFRAIEGATDATLAAEKIPVAAAGTAMYYCVVTASGEGVVADPVASKKVTVVVA